MYTIQQWGKVLSEVWHMLNRNKISRFSIIQVRSCGNINELGIFLIISL